jgi:hypothetical protein
LDAVVGEHDLDPVGRGGDKGLQEGARGLRIGLVDELSDRELGGAVDGDEEIELALRGLHFGDVDVEEADRIGLELPPRLFVAFHLRQSADAVALKTAMEGRARQMRDDRLQGVEAIVERQPGMPSEGDDHRLFFRGQDRRSGFLRPSRPIGDRGPPFPLGDGLLIDSVPLRQRSQARLTMLYRSTDRLCPLWRSRVKLGP